MTWLLVIWIVATVCFAVATWIADGAGKLLPGGLFLVSLALTIERFGTPK